MLSTPQSVSNTHFKAPKPAISQFDLSDLKPEKKLKAHQKTLSLKKGCIVSMSSVKINYQKYQVLLYLKSDFIHLNSFQLLLPLS